ncbi:MAG TPA: hypothetical protein VN222_07165, partial [Novosphingobium sp.]|nr:hypothetical protein [Novosphingobium sp.]
MMRRFLPAALGLALPLAALAAPPAAKPAGAMTPEAAEALYAHRFAQYMQGEAGMGLAFYDTLVPVAGAAHAAPLPAGNSGAAALPAGALAAARDYAGANNSSAFMVWHAGRLVAQDYFGGNGPDSLLVSKSLAKPLGVIAVGR